MAYVDDVHKPCNDVEIFFYAADDLLLLEFSSWEGRRLWELPWAGSSGGCWSSVSVDSNDKKKKHNGGEGSSKKKKKITEL